METMDVGPAKPYENLKAVQVVRNIAAVNVTAGG